MAECIPPANAPKIPAIMALVDAIADVRNMIRPRPDGPPSRPTLRSIEAADMMPDLSCSSVSILKSLLAIIVLALDCVSAAAIFREVA